MTHYIAQPARPGVFELARPYWFGPGRWKALAILAIVLAIIFGSVYLQVWANDLAGAVTDALVAQKWEPLRALLVTSLLVGTGAGAVVIVSVALQSVLQLDWRTALTNKLIAEWLSANAYYDIEREGALSNADQRIAEDVRLFTEQTINLSLNFIGVVASIITFTGVLWNLSGSLSLAPVGIALSIPGYMVYVAVLYNVVNLALVHWVGKRMIGLNMERQGTEADYRFSAMQVRNNAEQVAFYRGAHAERQRLAGFYDKVRRNFLALIVRHAKVGMTTTVYGALFAALPVIVALPRYLAGEITMGGITQVTGAYAALSMALNFFSQAYVSFTSLVAVSNRIRDLMWSIDKAALRRSGFLVMQDSKTTTDSVRTGSITLQDPLGRPLTSVAPLCLKAGERWLVRGPSGTGKSTLMRALAGLWPYGAGEISMPASARIMFLPQRSYLPTGTLKATLCYPDQPEAFDDDACRHALALCGLGQRLASLGAVDNWQQQLSGGEQQRLAFARVFLHRPDVVFLDEATSALDSDTEMLLYEALIELLPTATIVSVAHREALMQFHGHLLQLLPDAALRSDTKPGLS